MEEYAREVEKLSYKLLGWILSSLGLAGDKFHGCFKNQLSMVRLNYYPPCPFPHLALGVGRHKDSSAFTVLAQDEVGGLQVKRKSDGEWIPVRPFPNAYIINVGDIVQVSYSYMLYLSSSICNLCSTSSFIGFDTGLEQ